MQMAKKLCLELNMLDYSCALERVTEHEKLTAGGDRSMYWREVKMDYTVPDTFYEFQHGWYRDINLGYEADLLLEVLDSAQKENDIQSYIKENKKWFIPASIFEDYDFGHHEAYISVEQPLGVKYRADYMLRRNSISYHIVLVEFENMNVDYYFHLYG